jgi:hypothetical protein
MQPRIGQCSGTSVMPADQSLSIPPSWDPPSLVQLGWEAGNQSAMSLRLKDDVLSVQGRRSAFQLQPFYIIFKLCWAAGDSPRRRIGGPDNHDIIPGDRPFPHSSLPLAVRESSWGVGLPCPTRLFAECIIHIHAPLELFFNVNFAYAASLPASNFITEPEETALIAGRGSGCHCSALRRTVRLLDPRSIRP